MTTLVFSAHPDDETIGLGGQLADLERPSIVEVTDGAPRDLRDARAYGFAGWEEYARARWEELLKAMALAGIEEERVCGLGVPDQEASYDLAWLAHRVADLMEERRPALVFAPPYEGGHPDHDAVAFAVRAACRLMANPPEIHEYALYHCRDGALVRQEFLPDESAEAVEVALAPERRELKRRMIECFATQRETLAPFQTSFERRRRAPACDFAEPPKAGCIYYDRFPWGIESGGWRANARAALDALGLCGAI